MWRLKKYTTALFMALTVGTLLSACSLKAQMTSGETRVIKTVHGEAEVPADPQRVIATYCIGDVLTLGVKPVATYDVTGTAYEKEVAGLPVWGKFEAEEILSYDPDLIIVVNQEQYDVASKIAPTVLLPFTELSLEERVRFLGDVLNRRDEAEKALENFNLKLKEAKEALAEKQVMDKTVSIFGRDANGSIWVFGDKWGRGGDLIYSHLGFKAPEIVQNEIIAKDQYRAVSMEVIQDYAGDYIILSGDIDELNGNTIWESLPAVKGGRTIPIDFTLFYDIDIYSSRVQLDYLLDAMLNMPE
ncbi:iron complex transport system substrate-binding protein [Lacrimispora sphenoides]|jgi:iron complex transport system substrate-binding protein|uniref:ABC transporter substrate-binding protein n=1 Tax=Lacrimispora sphenoides TaxID=29370 RepID=UPI0008CD49CC|nr:ABC transporter substrate-binding protein [Lacrimispora sphenoides]SET77592.1 iron complex transport system substrate-binding protein [Lacrimispora sphenoides]